MRLILEICRERQLPSVINIHDVMLAKMFVDRIIGLTAGEVVFDGPPEAMDDAVLTRIYGEEDWTLMQAAAKEDAEDAAATYGQEQEPPPERTAEERMAGLA